MPGLLFYFTGGGPTKFAQTSANFRSWEVIEREKEGFNGRARVMLMESFCKYTALDSTRSSWHVYTVSVIQPAIKNRLR